MVNKYSEISKKNENTMPTLRVTEAKLTLRNAFILNLFTGEKESKYNEKTPFWGSLQKPDLSVNP